MNFLSYDDVRSRANEFLGTYNMPRNIPTPIENIAEFGFGIDIFPLPNLQQLYDIVGFISKDLKEIQVDEYIYHNRVGRLRFTVAHELGHAYLHKDVFEHADYNNANQWKQFSTNGIGDAQYHRMEIQANDFAGLILVPEKPLKKHFVKAIRTAEETGFDIHSDRESALRFISHHLSSEAIFNVSPQTVEIRIEKDSLFDLL